MASRVSVFHAPTRQGACSWSPSVPAVVFGRGCSNALSIRCVHSGTPRTHAPYNIELYLCYTVFCGVNALSKGRTTCTAVLHRFMTRPSDVDSGPAASIVNVEYLYAILQECDT